MIDFPCKTLEIKHPCSDKFTLNDGFGVQVLIDGKEPIHKRLDIVVEYGYQPEIRLTVCSYGGDIIWLPRKNFTGYMILRLEPEVFKLECGLLRVESKLNRYPFQILLNGWEPRVHEFKISFVEGEVPLIGLLLHPGD